LSSDVPVSSPVLRTSSSTSEAIWSKSEVPSGWKTMAAVPRVSIWWPAERWT
jgi:hypothetical protein